MTRFGVVLSLFFAFVFVDAGHGQEATLIFVQQPNNFDFDEQLIEHFEANYEVVPFDSTDPDVVDAADEADVVYVTESIGSGSIADAEGTIFQSLETPVIYAEAFAWDNAFLTGPVAHEDFGNTGRGEALGVSEDLDISESIYITKPDHAMAGGFSGEVTVHTEAYSVNYAWNEALGPGAEVIATADEAGEFPTLFVYEAGSELEDGSTTPGMRIGIFVGQSSSVPEIPSPIPFDILSEDGLALIDAVVEYALGNTGLPGDYNGNGEIDAGDLDVLSGWMKTNDLQGDLNSDGNTNMADRLAWISDIQQSWVGDSNFDGEFNSSDFVVVFQAGKYEVDTTAGYAEGDWSGDLRFDSGDFVTAFQGGGFEAGPLAAVAVVPEPSSMTLLLLATMAIFSRRRKR